MTQNESQKQKNPSLTPVAPQIVFLPSYQSQTPQPLLPFLPPDMSGAAGGPAPAPTAPAPVIVHQPKSHVARPEDFVDSKDYDKFNRQIFVYTAEYHTDFSTDESRIRFALSFMKGGLPEKFVANYINQVMVMPAATTTWKTWADFATAGETSFGDKNKRTNAEDRIALLKQGSKSVEEFNQEFNQLAFVAGYKDTHHNDVLIKLLQEGIKTSIIDDIYRQPTLPADYNAWKERIINMDNLAHQRQEQKKAHPTTTFHKPTTFVKKPDVPNIKTSTRITYGGSGRRMDVDKARTEGQCFRCGKQGHISRFCPDKPKMQVRNIVESLTEEEKQELKKELEGFPSAQ